MNKIFFFLLISFYFSSIITGKEISWVTKPVIKFEATKKIWKINFEISDLTDVEVSIINSKGKIIRHLAAGVLGKNPPSPLQANSKAQSLMWDGKDDYRKSVTSIDGIKVQVKVGMKAQLEKIAGGDPYAFFSSEMEHYNHNIWTIAGLEAKPDGSVYIYGSAGMQGIFTIRKYDSNGNYQKTVFPFPAGMPKEKVTGWGINIRDDGTYTPALTKNNVSWPCFSQTAINKMGGFGPQPILIPNLANDKLTILATRTPYILTLNTDGSIDKNQINKTDDYFSLDPHLSKPNDKKDFKQVRGPYFTCFTADKKSVYLSGFFHKKNPFWRHGQVLKMDLKTKKVTPWFSLPENLNYKFPKRTYSSIHGVAIDDQGHVFVCNRAQSKLMIMDQKAKIIKEIKIPNLDAIAYDSESKTIYATTRTGFNVGKANRGTVNLLKINDWKSATKPDFKTQLCVNDMAILDRDRSYLAVTGKKGKRRIWVAFKDIPVKIYQDDGKKLSLVKDFYQSGRKLRYLAFYRMIADPLTENIYMSSGNCDVFKLSNWENPTFTKCSEKEIIQDSNERYRTNPRQIFAGDVTLDPKNRYLLARIRNKKTKGKIYRYTLDGKTNERINVGNTNSPACSDSVLTAEWPGGRYMDRGICPSIDGAMISLSGPIEKNGQFKVHLNYHPVDPKTGPKPMRKLADIGTLSGGVRMDLQGNIYVAMKVDKKLNDIPKGFKNDSTYNRLMGRIVKFTPTGTLESGCLYPTAPKGYSKVYNVHAGHFAKDSNGIGFSIRFGVDGYGRIYYPNVPANTVSVMDNEGNAILKFGTYGNLDAWLNIENKWSLSKSIPMSFPSAVDSTDNYIYVSDFVNNGVIKIKKNYALEAISK